MILFIVTDYCINKNNVEAFKTDAPIDCDDSNISNEEKINCGVKKLKEKRNNLVDTINQPEQKRKNNAEYLTKIKTKINDILEEEIKERTELKEVEEEKIKSIKDKLIYLNNYININVPEKKFNSVRSLHNGIKLSIKEMEGNSHYLVKLNNKNSSLDEDNIENCLSVKANGTYEIEKCDPENKQQYFNLQNIPNGTTYKKNLEKGIIRNKRIPDNVNYPFNLIKSVNNKNCLQNFNNQISVTPCETKKSHRWEPLEEHIYCSRDENGN